MGKKGLERLRIYIIPELHAKVLRRGANLLLGALAFVFAAWAAYMLVSPAHLNRAQERPQKTRHEKKYENRAIPAVWYDIVVEKDIFREERREKVNLPAPGPKPKPKPEPLQAALPPKPPPPRLTLIGTVLLDDGEAAILDNAGAARGAAYYRVGDDIEGFVVRRIQKDMVLLERDGETLNVTMTPANRNHPAGAEGAPQNSNPQDIPAALVPRPARMPHGLAPQPSVKNPASK